MNEDKTILFILIKVQKKRGSMNYDELEIKSEIAKAINDIGFVKMTEIQEQAIPVAMNGQDVLGQAQTGTGKTAAFVIPVLERLDLSKPNVQCLMLAPTRELAIQITAEINKLAKYMKVNAITVYGGEPIDRQMRLLRQNPQIVVGTPGRVMDLINRKKLKLHEVDFFVLDEVDEMLNMGFLDDVEIIAKGMPKHKQTLLFSATLPDRIKKIASDFLVDPKIIKVDAKSMTVDKVKQFYIEVKNKSKMQVLENLLLLRQGQKIIIFGQTRRSCDEIYDFLKEKKYRAGKIHGDIAQNQRTETINQFRNNKFDILVASDVVARGIDIDGIELVINYELPQDMEYYIHRIGRTGRGDAKQGESITLVSPAVYQKEFRHYPKRLKCDIELMQAPSFKEMKELLVTKYYADIESNMASSSIKEIYLELGSQMADKYPAELLTSYLLSKLYPELGAERKIDDQSSSRGGNHRKRSGNGNGGGDNRNRNRNRNDQGGNRGGRGSRSEDGNRSGGKKHYGSDRRRSEGSQTRTRRTK